MICLDKIGDLGIYFGLNHELLDSSNREDISLNRNLLPVI